MRGVPLSRRKDSGAGGEFDVSELCASFGVERDESATAIADPDALKKYVF
jgi:hypothetical protein